MAKKRNAKQVVQAIKGSGGLITTIAKRLGVSWNTAKRYIDQYATAQKALEAERMAIIDIAEENIIRSVKTGSIGTSKWFLTRQGRDRGYGDHIDVDADIEVGIVGYVGISPDDWDDVEDETENAEKNS